jgi:hypothetical protein
MSAYDPKRTLVSSTLTQEDISGGIRNAGKVASMVARTLQDPAMGDEPLHSADICERPAAAVVHDIELEPGNVIRSCTGRIADRLAYHGAAVHVLPGQTGVMPPDRLVVEDQRCDRLPEDPSLPSLPALRVDMSLHPFTRAGNREFNTFLWMPASGARAGDIVLVDLTMFTTLFGGGESLDRFWNNLATRT